VLRVAETRSCARRCTGMPHFFFHVFNDEITLDEEGADFPDLASARAEGLRAARGLAAASVVEHGHLVLSHRIDVVSTDGRVAQVFFREAVDVRA